MCCDKFIDPLCVIVDRLRHDAILTNRLIRRQKAVSWLMLAAILCMDISLGYVIIDHEETKKRIRTLEQKG